MIFSDPSIVLTYMDSSTTATIGKQYIIKNSIQVREQLLNGLESSSSTIQLSLDSSCPEIPYILNAESDIKAVLRDGVTVIWTGYVSDGFSWTVGPAGTSVLRIVLEDLGSKLLEKPYIRGERAQLIDDNGLAAITSICSVAGITVSSTVPTITTPVIRVVKEGERCKDLLRTLCFELGYAYYFNGAGELCLKKIDCVSVTGIPVLNKDDLYIVGGKGLQLDKKVRQYKSAVLSFREYASKTGVLVYKDISGQTTGYPDCKIPMTAGGYYPASSISSYQAQDLEGGAEVVYLSSVTGSIGWKDGGAGTATITKQNGANSIGVRVACSSSGTLSKLQATGDIVVVSAESEVSQGEVSASGESDNCYTRELQWIHTNTTAAPIANMVVDFYKYCNRQFTFRAEDDYDCGDLVKVYDDQFSGIAVNLLIYAKEYSDESEIVTYRAYSVSPFNLGRAATTITTRTPTTDVNVFIPESDVVSCNLVVTPQIFYKDYRDTSSATISFKYFYNGNSTPPANLVWSAVTNTGYSYTVTTDSATEAHISVAHNTSASSLTISAYVTGLQTATYVEQKLTYEDITQYNKNWGTLTALPSGIVLDGDYFIAGSNFSSYVLGKPYVRSNNSWVNLTADSVENTTKLFNLMSNVMASDLTVPATSAMYAWFGTLIAQDAAIQNLFSKNITILNNGSIHSAAYDANGSYIGPGPGFYLGADGELKCYSANTSDLNAVNANISGNSSFHGSFDCTLIKTTPESPSTYITLNGSVADGAQAKRITDQMLLNGLISDYATAQTTSPMFPIQIVGVSGISYMQVAYQGGAVQSGTTRYRSTIRFYDSSRNQVNIRNYITCSKSSNLNWGDNLSSSNYDYGSDTSYHGQWASNGIEIRVLTGLNRLWVDVPNAASASTLSSGMLFKATTATTVGGISCYPLYVKA